MSNTPTFKGYDVVHEDHSNPYRFFNQRLECT